jgi:L-cysteine S-thiosulfotransferase
MSPDIRAMQDDDFLNPGMLWVDEGAALWTEAPASGPACAGCHGEPASLAGVAARYPAWDDALGRPVDLEARVNLCRTRHQDAEPFARESRPLLALTALVAHQSRGMPIAPPGDTRLASARARGSELWATRMGQLDLSCAECHDDHPGGRLAAALIPQGHPTGYPLYRLEWQELGSLDRRFRGCLIGVRAEPFEPGSTDSVALKAFLAVRAAGLPVETPAVRP